MAGYRARMTGTGVVAKQARDVRPGPGSLGEILTQIGQLGTGIIKQEGQLQEQQLDAAHEADIAELQRKRSATIAQKMGEMAELEGSIDQELDSQRNFVDPAEWDKKSSEIVQARWTTFADTLGDDPEVRTRFEPAIIRQRESTISREEDLSRIERAKINEQGFETWATAAKGKMSRADKPDEVFQNYLTDLVTYSSALDMPRSAVKDLIESEARDGATQMFDRLIVQQRFDEAEKLANSPAFDALLGGDPRAKIIGAIGNERRAAAALAEAEASAARTEARNDIKAVEEKIKLGINPTPDEIAAVRKKALAAGLTDADIIGLDGMGIQQAVNRQYSEAADPTGAKAAAAAAVLSVKIANNTANEAEQVSYQQLKGIADARSKATGSAMSDLAAKGPQGQMEVLGQLNALPAEQRYTAAKAAGGNKGEWLGRVSQLPQKTQQFVVDGRAARTDRPKDFGDAAVVRKSYQNILGSGLAADLGGGYAEVMDIAWDIYAGSTAARGESGFDEGNFRKAVRIAFGATVNKDGILQGGVATVNGRTTILPDTYTAPDMEKQLARADFSGAVYRDGSAAAKADILANYRMVWIGYTATGAKNYKFVDASGNPLMFKNGEVATKGFR